MISREHDRVQLALTAGGILRVQVLAPHTFRVRLRQDDEFAEPALVRYGVLRSQWPDVPFRVEEQAGKVHIRTSGAILSIRPDDGRVTLADAQGQRLIGEALAPWSSPKAGFGAEFSLADDEKLYGLGDVTRDRLQKRGFKTIMWVRNVASYVPIPYVMSSRGWALFLNYN